MTHPSVALVVDDEIQMRRLLRVILESADIRVCETDSGESALLEVVYRKPDVVILDLGLPDVDGLTVLTRLREWSRVPILVLSVRSDEKQKVEALDAGADDYMTKPFGAEELLARLRVIRRHLPGETGTPAFEDEGLIIDYPSRSVTLHGKEIRLTTTEYSLLRLLTQNSGKVLTHKHILREIWGRSSENQTQYLRVYFTHLRQKIERDPARPERIITEPRIGYRYRVNHSLKSGR